METPYSEQFQDVYFSKDGGLEESNYVFLEGNQLSDKFTNLEKPIFTVAETGFGTGLNFLCTWKLWEDLEKHNSNSWLHYISVEGFPLTGDEIKDYLSGYSELAPYLNKFLSEYKLLTKGFYRFIFPESRVSLLILYGLANDVLPDLEANVDTWYLDGFAPAKNPEIWSETVFKAIERLSSHNTSFATYTSASFVRRNLKSIGFEVEKVKGYGKKREMLVGKLTNGKKPNIKPLQEWPKEFSIAGAGIAGSSLAYALSLRGIPVTVYDPSGIAEEGSGNPSGIFYPFLSKYPTPASLFSLQSYFYTIHALSKKEFSFTIISKGLNHILDTKDIVLRYSTAIIEHELPLEIVSFEYDPDRLYFPYGYSLSPKHFIKKLLENVNFIQSALPESVLNAGYNYALCNAFSIQESLEKLHIPPLPLKKVRGQVAIVESEDLEQPITQPACCNSYISPHYNNQYVVGSTYDEFTPDRDWSMEDEKKILEELGNLVPLSRKSKEDLEDWYRSRKDRIEMEMLNSTNRHSPNKSNEGSLYRVSHRAQSRDRQPIIGNYLGEWIFTGLGSKGLVVGLLGGEVLASLILGEPLPIPLSVYKAITPERYSKTHTKH
jgi:tRNA 5-methylaminomethyl-2-thiouridine biosynthesis bifunctional protein